MEKGKEANVREVAYIIAFFFVIPNFELFVVYPWRNVN